MQCLGSNAISMHLASSILSNSAGSDYSACRHINQQRLEATGGSLPIPTSSGRKKSSTPSCGLFPARQSKQMLRTCALPFSKEHVSTTSNSLALGTNSLAQPVNSMPFYQTLIRIPGHLTKAAGSSGAVH